MKKYSFLIYHKAYDEFVESIRDAGVVHIVEKQKGIPEDAVDLRRQLHAVGVLKNTLHALQKRAAGVTSESEERISAEEVAAQYEQLKTAQDSLVATQQKLRKEIERIAVWGDFDGTLADKIKATGHELRFYSCRARDFKAGWRDDFNAIEIAAQGSMLWFVAVCPADMQNEPAAERAHLPAQSLSQLRRALQETQAEAQHVERQLNRLATAHVASLQEALRQANASIDLSKVRLHAETKAGDKLILLEGWVPLTKEPELLLTLERQQAWFEGKMPEKDDNSVPVLLRNNRFARLFEPIGELYDLPNYRELDLTPFFAPFFLLFFGLCLGDAGYGLLLLIAALALRRKMKPSMRPLLMLTACLGAATMVLGVVSGTFFGIPLPDMQWQWLASFKKIMLDSDRLFNLSLIIGGVQIVFAMVVKAVGRVRRYGWKYSLETWGWLLMILSAGGLVLMHKQWMPSPDMARYLCYIAVGAATICIFLLNTPGRNPLVNVGTGLWNSYNMATGLLGDLLSYIRLFALGISGSVMGLVFNRLAVSISGDIPVVSWIVMLLILLIGHSLNIFMSGLGALVHPMRLTFVEFYKNAGFEGGGKKYKPLGG
ncbi:MAG: hypothetical protein LBS09_03085 [Bacteroidales bacterium]|nr:hypothetical protein [Bacteroidales bacterium]